MKKLLSTLLCLVFVSCGVNSLEFSKFSKSMDVINSIDLKKYLGTWYEYARLDVSFERGMINTQAKYALLEPDKEGRTWIKVTNSGEKNGKAKKAEGKAVIADPNQPARLMVSFFGPFYGDYNIIALDTEHYRWALVAGGSKDYLWILTREKDLDPKILYSLKTRAQMYGFDTDKLIYPQE